MLKIGQWPEVSHDSFPKKVPSNVTPTLQLAACYFIVNWASVHNNYRVAVMIAMVATVAMGAAIKLEAATKAIWLLALIGKCDDSGIWCPKVDYVISVNCSLFC